MTNARDFTFGRAELEAAVAKGVLDRSAADSLTEFLIQNRNAAASDPDEERLRLITGFNDIFVTIGIALFLGALYYLLGLWRLQGQPWRCRCVMGPCRSFHQRENAWPCQALCCLSRLS